MEYNIINVGENPEEIRYKFIKNAGAKSKMILSGFTQATSMGKSYVSDIPPLSLFFTSLISEVNKDTAVKIISIYDIQDDIKANNNSKNVDDIRKMVIKLKLNSMNECLDVDISGINKDNALVTSIADSLKQQYQQMKKFPETPVGVGGSWSFTLNTDASNYVFLYTLHEKNNSMIKFDYVLSFNSNKEQLVKKNNELNFYKEVFGSAVAHLTCDRATGDSEMFARNFTTSISEMTDMDNCILNVDQTLITSVEFVSDLPIEKSNIKDILTNIKNDKFPKMYS